MMLKRCQGHHGQRCSTPDWPKPCHRAASVDSVMALLFRKCYALLPSASRQLTSWRYCKQCYTPASVVLLLDNAVHHLCWYIRPCQHCVASNQASTLPILQHCQEQGWVIMAGTRHTLADTLVNIDRHSGISSNATPSAAST
jgi:hypothetical protein